jgi:outer membrane protein assembly factor BamB
VLVRLALGAALVFAVAPQSRACAQPGDWRQFRGGADNTGYLAGDLRARWRYKAPGAVRAMSVARNRVLVGTEILGETARPPGTIAALSLTTGERIWTHDLPAWVHGDPAIVDSTAFVTFGAYPFDLMPGGLWAFDMRSGRIRWKFESGAGMMPAPAVVGSVIFAGGGDTCIHSLSSRTGRQLHAWCTGAPIAMASPRIADSLVIVGNVRGYLIGYNTVTFREQWRRRWDPIDHFGDPPAAFAHGLAITTGTHRFKPDSQRHWVVAFNAVNGDTAWRRLLGTGPWLERNTSGTPAVAGGIVVVSSPIASSLHAFDARSGAPRWSMPLESQHKGAPTIVGEDVVLGDAAGRLSVRALRSGNLLGVCRFDAPFTVLAPLVVGQTILVATQDGWVYAEPYDQLRARAAGHVAASAPPCLRAATGP